MEQRIRDRFDAALLEHVAAVYGVSASAIRPIRATENFVYEFERGGEAFILRISHTFRRSPELLHGELDWMTYVAERGASVARPVRSARGHWVEMFDDGGGEHFVVTAFHKAPGKPPWERGWTADLLETYGRLLGKMHSLTGQYVVGDPSWQRPRWNDVSMDFPSLYLPTSERAALIRYREHARHLLTLPQDASVYGLIHQDAHSGNFVVDDTGRITLFDFDDCAYGWFAYDIAVTLFHAVLDEIATDEERSGLSRQDDERASDGSQDLQGMNIAVGLDTTRFAIHFLRAFLAGYRQEHSLDGRWVIELPHFLKLREIELFAVMFRDYGGEEGIDDPWCASFMRGRKARIDNGVPFLDLDWSAFSASR